MTSIVTSTAHQNENTKDLNDDWILTFEFLVESEWQSREAQILPQVRDVRLSRVIDSLGTRAPRRRRMKRLPQDARRGRRATLSRTGDSASGSPRSLGAFAVFPPCSPDTSLLSPRSPDGAAAAQILASAVPRFLLRSRVDSAPQAPPTATPAFLTLGPRTTFKGKCHHGSIWIVLKLRTRH